MEEYSPLALQPQIISIFVVMIILLIISFVYFKKVGKIPENQAPKGFVLIAQIYIGFIRNLVVEVMGPKFEKITPFFIYLFSYIILSNIIGIVGFEPPTSSLTVTFSLAIVTWIGIFVVGIKYQKASYIKTFCLSIKIKGKKIPVMINPIEIISKITPLISLSFRLWGNIFAGSLILTLWFFMTAYIWNFIPVIGLINLLGAFTSMPIHAYFDLLCGSIQALIFVMLTMIYWTLESGNQVETTSKHKIVKNKSVDELNVKININN